MTVPTQIHTADIPLLETPDQLARAPRGVPVRVAHGLIRPSPLNPRRHVADEEPLAASLLAEGQLQNLTARLVTSEPGEPFLELAAGERRWRAMDQLLKAAAAGKLSEEDSPHLAALAFPWVVIRELSDVELLRIALGENGQRGGLDPLDEASAFARLVELGQTQEQIAQARGCDRTLVAKRLGLLDLSEEAKRALTQGDLSLNVAYRLRQIKDETLAAQAFQEARAAAAFLAEKDLVAMLAERYVTPQRQEEEWERERESGALAEEYSDAAEVLSYPKSRELLEQQGTHALFDDEVGPEELAPTYHAAGETEWGDFWNESIPYVVAWTPEGAARAVEKDLVREWHREKHRTITRSNPEDPAGPPLVIQEGTPLECPFPLTDADGGMQKRAAAEARRQARDQESFRRAGQCLFLERLQDQVRTHWEEAWAWPLLVRASLFLLEGDCGALLSLEKLMGVDLSPAEDSEDPAGIWDFRSWPEVESLPGFAALVICAGVADTLTLIEQEHPEAHPTDEPHAAGLAAFCEPFQFEDWREILLTHWPRGEDTLPEESPAREAA